MRRARRDNGRRKGTAAVEFTLAALMTLLPLALGMVDFGVHLNARHVLSRAVQEGMTHAVLGEDPAQAIRDTVSRSGLDPDRTGVALTASDPVPALGTRMTLTVTYDLDGLVLVPWVSALSRLSTVRVTAVGRHT